MAKKRNYTRDEYLPEERALMDELYEGHYQRNFVSKSIEMTSKELEENQVLRVRISTISGNQAMGETSVGQSVSIDLTKEEKAIKRLGFPPIEVSVGCEFDVVVFSDKSGYYN